jgi:ATP-dependent Clp protease ATP-binding subunit ClpC
MAFVRLTERARDVIEIARREAEDLRHDHIGTEHVLLGLLREGGGIAAKLTQTLGLKINQIRKGVAMLNPVAPHGAASHNQVTFSDRLRTAIKSAEDTARNLGHEDVGIAHLFLGLTEDEQSKASLLLINLGLDFKAIRDDILQKLSSPG